MTMKTPGLKIGVMTWLTLDKASSELDRNENLVSFMNMEEVARTWEPCGLGREGSEEI